MQTAFASKGFTWLSGSPTDNEKLSIGKNAQLFGFVALHYQSGRAANRGALGRAFHSIATETQRTRLAEAVRAEGPLLEEWWSVREQMLRLLEAYLYEGRGNYGAGEDSILASASPSRWKISRSATPDWLGSTDSKTTV